MVFQEIVGGSGSKNIIHKINICLVERIKVFNAKRLIREA
jgi:hypothetical protein